MGRLGCNMRPVFFGGGGYNILIFKKMLTVA